MLAKTAIIAPFRATVVSQSAGLVYIQREGAASADTMGYAKVSGFSLSTSDVVLCLNYGGQPVVLGKVQNSAPTGYVLDTGLDAVNLTVDDTMRYGRSGGTPTVTPLAGSGSGSTITATVLNDSHGEFTLNSIGTGQAAGAVVRISRGNAVASSTFDVIFVPRSINSANVNAYLASRSTGFAEIGFGIAPVAGQSYAFSWIWIN